MQQELEFDFFARPEAVHAGIGTPVEIRDTAGLVFAAGVLDSYRIRLQHAFDKLSSLSNSRTRLLPHQIEATHRVVEAVRPRFILADEVGLGKTIEAGLVMKELIFRRGYRRVFVAVPAPLIVQWQQEMRSKFNEDFFILNRKTWHDGSWKGRERIITSIDFIKNERYAKSVCEKRWDIVVFDEAHRLRRDYSKVTHAYSFAEKMAEQCEALLLLTATPFRGKLEELFFLVRLVDPHVLGPFSSFIQEHVLDPDRDPGGLREKIGKILIRRRKIEVGGFTKRNARTIRFELSPDERTFYDATTEYVKREYNLALREKDNAVGFVMIVFQKLLDSSTRALLSALEKRKHMLESVLSGPISQYIEEDEDEDDWFDDENPEDRPLTGEERRRKTASEIRKEVLILKQLTHLGRSVKQDRKLQKLRETLLKLRKEGHAKFIIFTQFRTTLEYLAEQLPEFRVVVFHGSLSLHEKEAAITKFRLEDEVLICTEAGGEGRNLQFASILFNYDLPWSPLKIEQRIGRIHRFGQKSDVFIFNFSTRDTVAERVLEVLETKIRLFEESIGPSDALLGAIQDEAEFQKGFMSWIAGRKTKREWNDDLDARLKMAKDGYSILNELLAPKLLDFNLHDYYEFTRQAREIDNDAIERITRMYLELYPEAAFALEADSDPAVRKKGVLTLVDLIHNIRHPATFRSDTSLEREDLEFLAVGHPLVDRALNFFLLSPGQKTIARLAAPSETGAGVYFIFLCRTTAGRGHAELLSCFVPDHREGDAFIPEDLLVSRESLLRSRPLPGIALQPQSYEDVYQTAFEKVEGKAKTRAAEVAAGVHGLVEKEEIKLEVSFGKKIRSLEEKRDIQKLRVRTHTGPEHRALLAKIENQLDRARVDKARAIARIRSLDCPDVSVSLLQTYVFE